MPCQEPLGPANRMAAGSVLWILAMVDGSQEAKAPGENSTPCNQSHSLQSFHHAAQYIHTRTLVQSNVHASHAHV